MAKDPEAKLREAEQRIERERARKKQAERELREQERKRDTRQKIFAGAYVLDVLYPQVGQQRQREIADGIGNMIAYQTQKKASTRRQEVELYRERFGDQWASRWLKEIGDG